MAFNLPSISGSLKEVRYGVVQYIHTACFVTPTQYARCHALCGLSSVNVLAPYGLFPLFCRISLILFPRKFNNLVDLCFIYNRLPALGCFLFLSFLARNFETLGWAVGNFASRGSFETFLLTGFSCAAEDTGDDLDTAKTMGQLDVRVGGGFGVRHTCHRLPELDT